MKKYILISCLIILLNSCSHSQNTNDARQVQPKSVGGGCEGCEALFDYDPAQLNPVDTLPDFGESGEKLKIHGIIYQPDGTTPAPNVILYVYHTDQQGLYSFRDEDTTRDHRHGYIRGWIKTDETGRYEFYTLKPGAYPSRTIAAHIHPIILEPDGRYYWLGGYHFEDDPLLTDRERSPKSPRGGSTGLLKLKKEGESQVGIRDFVLGENIPGYE